MRLHLGGHLSWYDPQKRSWLELQLPEPTRLAELLARLGVPAAEVAIAVLNGRAAEIAERPAWAEEVIAADGDQVELYPPIGGGSGLGGWV
jgi:sulfur carrier protein ThiS